MGEEATCDLSCAGRPGPLLRREPAPQAVPVCAFPPRGYEAARNTGPYSSSGLATAGFRSARYSPDEWHQNNHARFSEASAHCDGSERARRASRQLAAEAEARARRTQADATKQLGERLQDLHFWKAELQREIEELTGETALLLAQKLRLEKALDALDLPYSIAMDNLQCRERRRPPDLVRDGAEIQLLKEAELIRNVQELLKRTLMQAVNQIQLNRDQKQTCEMDWSDKIEAYNIDETCGHYNNQSTVIQSYPHSSKLEDSASHPDSWAKFSHDNIHRAERERTASASLRSLIDSVLHDTAEDVHMQFDAVNQALALRCEEVEDAKHKLEHNLHMTLTEIGSQENTISSLKQAIKDKETPLKVAQTRLYQRSQRPNVELCKDEAQLSLVHEVEELTQSIGALKQKLLEAEQALRSLEDTRMSLEKEIDTKSHSLFIDRQQCLAHRSRYPDILKLAGYR
ncbi:tektin-4 isoform X1 [Tachyglossus aculeatus]|uniref:tektin-4 isoform X1 n=1 Tax=Tachyglossus aculeatus TaxID=9261 RepID=UPI0018F5CE3A|nr:tektin-4 isoform X1 [Tachyglossus aculeatus]